MRSATEFVAHLIQLSSDPTYGPIISKCNDEYAELFEEGEHRAESLRKTLAYSLLVVCNIAPGRSSPRKGYSYLKINVEFRRNRIVIGSLRIVVDESGVCFLMAQNGLGFASVTL